MCGFAGYTTLRSCSQAVEIDLLQQMQQKLVHRGPDGNATWISTDRKVGFAFQRLSIIDLSQRAMQPMSSSDGTVCIVFNGEIYNYAQLRTRLESAGCVFITTSDTEVILHAYRTWGSKFLDSLDGMFAIALYDQISQKLLLVRDRFGVKPLYFTLQQGRLAFASEIKALRVLPWVQSRINPRALAHYLSFLVTPAPYTMLDGIYKLPAGCYAQCDEYNNVTFTRWYDPAAVLAQPSPLPTDNDQRAVVHDLTDLLINATKKRMVADVPVGAFLSGGIDSSLNVALMSQYATNINTFTARFAGSTAHDEGHWAQRVASEFGTKHHEIIIDEQDAYKFYPSMVHQLDEPLADCVCIPFYFVAQLAHQQGIKVVQVGEGADELFFGYPLYARYAQVNHLWQPAQKLLPGYLKQAAHSLTSALYGPATHMADLAYRMAAQQPLFVGGATGFGTMHKQQILALPSDQDLYDPLIEKIIPGLPQTNDSWQLVAFYHQQLAKVAPHADLGQHMLYLELMQRLPELLLMRADKMAMANSVEAREPFLDKDLIAYLLHIPQDLRFKNKTTKYLLKQVARRFLPAAIIDRPKVGFGAPTLDWQKNGAHFPAYFAQLSQGPYLHRSGPSRPMFNSRDAVLAWIVHQYNAFAQQIPGSTTQGVACDIQSCSL